ncbi:hypothetical protein [Aquimarina rubra]|uniref:DNA-binding protein n=1 Tax=Aquimarina rubra TaxID=1920033 RepID=A0ABW5LLF8_9FLAO
MVKKLLNSGIFWTVIVGIVGVVITIIFYEFSNKMKEPVYSIVKEPSLIFDKENATSNFKLLSKDSTIIQQNVYVTTIVAWNNGDLEISKGDVRKKIKVTVSDQNEILEYKITKQTNPEISNFKLKQFENELIVDWDYFDPKFGFEFQVIYSGTEETQIEMEGYIIGAKVKKVALRPKGAFNKYFGIFALIVNIYLVFIVFKDFKRATWKYYLFQSFILMIGLAIALWLINKYFFSGYISPF